MGAAGKLLDELLAHIGYVRSQVYIANVLKCRPPEQPGPAARRDRDVHAVPRAADRADRPRRDRHARQVRDPVRARHDRADLGAARATVPGRRAAGRARVPSGRGPLRLVEALGAPRRLLAGSRRSSTGRATGGQRRARVPETGSPMPDGVTTGSSHSSPKERQRGAGGTIVTVSEAETHRAGLPAGPARPARRRDRAVRAASARARRRSCRAIAEGLGIVGHVPSPTFNILLVHRGDRTLYHFDLYRLERPEQLEDVDFYETLESGGVSRDRVGGPLPRTSCRLTGST